MRKWLNNWWLGLILLMMGAGVRAQDLNLEHDVRGRPFASNVVTLPAEGTDRIVWEFESVLNAIINNTVSETLGVKGHFTPSSIERLKIGRRSTPWMRKFLQSRHFLIKSNVEGSDIFYNDSGKEIFRHLSFQLEIINLATSRVERVIRVQCGSRRYLERAKKEKAEKYPNIDIHEWAIGEHAAEILRKQLNAFFYTIEPIIEWRLEDKKDKGFFTKFRGGYRQRPHKTVDIIAVVDMMDTPTGPVPVVAHIGTAKYMKEKTKVGMPFYRITIGKGRIEKGLKKGWDLYMYPDDSLL